MALPGVRVDERMMAALATAVVIVASVPSDGDLKGMMDALRAVATQGGCQNPRVSVAVVEPGRAEIEVICADLPGVVPFVPPAVELPPRG